MAQVSININGRQYGIACDDGQEQRVRDLATYINASVGDRASAGAAQNEAHLLVLAALVLTDEVFELKEKNKTLNLEIERLASEKDIPVATPDVEKDTTEEELADVEKKEIPAEIIYQGLSPEDEATIRKAVDHLRKRVEKLTQSLQDVA
ncbi:MAG: hypothetical protein CL565_01060 [Alphaproteobacteria bacterium]|nr:hypothetical protein [Alphaproteobacteria bacterium]